MPPPATVAGGTRGAAISTRSPASRIAGGGRGSGSGDTAGLIASIDAIGDLEADNILDLVKIAEARGECLGILEPTFSPKLSTAERAALRKRCGDRGIAALTLAVEKGYNNLRHLEGDPWEMHMIGNLRNQPGYARLVAVIKARRPGGPGGR